MQSKSGVTLIELVITIVVIALIAGASVPFMLAATDAWQAISAQRNGMDNARFALNRMAREIREIDSDLSTAIISKTATHFRFIDIDGNEIRFQKSGTILRRRVKPSGGSWQGWDTMLTNLKASGGLNFTYLDENSNTTSIATDIRMVQIRLQLESTGVGMTVQTLARFRNVTS